MLKTGVNTYTNSRIGSQKYCRSRRKVKKLKNFESELEDKSLVVPNNYSASESHSCRSSSSQGNLSNGNLVEQQKSIINIKIKPGNQLEDQISSIHAKNQHKQQSAI